MGSTVVFVPFNQGHLFVRKVTYVWEVPDRENQSLTRDLSGSELLVLPFWVTCSLPKR